MPTTRPTATRTLPGVAAANQNAANLYLIWQARWTTARFAATR